MANVHGHLTPKETLEAMLGHLGFLFEIKEEDRIIGPTLHVLSRHSARLIGRDGKTLEDLQYLLNRIISSHEDASPKVIVDVENYRANQQEELIAYVRSKVEEVRKTGKSIELEPMNSFDRRVIHLTFKGDPDIETYSPESTSRIKQIILRKRNAS